MEEPVGLENFTFVGHAIVSADGKIADRNGRMPEQLYVEADWQEFQNALDNSDLVVLGRKGHGNHPNPGRKRLVLTGRVAGIVQDSADPLSRFWNPATLPLEDVLAQLGLSAGTIAVTGGQGVFNFFAPLLDAFELVECSDVTLPGGVDCFSTGTPRAVLVRLGFKPELPRTYDVRREVTATYWQKNSS